MNNSQVKSDVISSIYAICSGRHEVWQENVNIL